GAAAAPVQQAPSPAAGGRGGETVIGSPTVTLPAPRSPVAMFQEELTAVLRMLRPLILTGLQGRRRALDAVPEFSSWRQQQPRQQLAELPPAPVTSAMLADNDAVAMDMDVDAAGGEDAYGRLMRQRMRQQMELLKAHPTAAERPAAAASYGLDPAVAAELLARIDADLLNTHEAALQGALPPLPLGEGATNIDVAAGPPEVAASATPPSLDDSKMSPAEYAYAVLKYVQYVDALCEAAPAEEAQRQADAALQLAAPGLALRLLQLWSAATSAEFKQRLGLPPAEVEKRILEEQLRREEMARAAAALTKPGGGSGSGSGAPSDAAPGSPAAASRKKAAAMDESGTVQAQSQGQGRGQRPSAREGQRIREGQEGRDRADGPRRGGQHQHQQPRRGPGQGPR
ncbi:hypothetical protein Vafri_20009, partial [Volvox africanus]